MWRVEFHCHTIYSKDSLLRLDRLLHTCARRGIDRVFITDHNTLDGAREAIRLDAEHVLVGEEIMTTQGELLAFFVEEEIPAGLTPEEAIRRLRVQGALISVAHPFDCYRGGAWRGSDLQRIIPMVDAIETFNARCIQPRFNRRAQAFAQAHNLASTVGSDAHGASEIGRATLLLPEFHDAESLRQALKQAQPRLHLSPPWVHLISRYAKWRKNFPSFIN